MKAYEERVKEVVENLILNGTDVNKQEFHRLQVEYIKHLNVKDAILRQKSQLYGLNMEMQIPVIFMPLSDEEEEECLFTK